MSPAREPLRTLGERPQLLGAEETRTRVSSPTYRGALFDARGVAMVDPARLAWGLADAAEAGGAVLVEDTPVTGLRDAGDHVHLATAQGTVRARQVVLALEHLYRARAHDSATPSSGLHLIHPLRHLGCWPAASCG